jgi:hypothetical protein
MPTHPFCALSYSDVTPAHLLLSAACCLKQSEAHQSLLKSMDPHQAIQQSLSLISYSLPPLQASHPTEGILLTKVCRAHLQPIYIEVWHSPHTASMVFPISTSPLWHHPAFRPLLTMTWSSRSNLPASLIGMPFSISSSEKLPKVPVEVCISMKRCACLFVQVKQ